MAALRMSWSSSIIKFSLMVGGLMPRVDVWVDQVQSPHICLSVEWSGHDVLSLFINIEVSDIYCHITSVITELA